MSPESVLSPPAHAAGHPWPLHPDAAPRQPCSGRRPAVSGRPNLGGERHQPDGRQLPEVLPSRTHSPALQGSPGPSPPGPVTGCCHHPTSETRKWRHGPHAQLSVTAPPSFPPLIRPYTTSPTRGRAPPGGTARQSHSPAHRDPSGWSGVAESSPPHTVLTLLLGFRAVDLIRHGGKKMRFLVAKSDVETAKKIRFRSPPP